MDKKAQALKLIADILETDTNKLSLEMEIKDVEGWDSLVHIQIIGELEENFHISIPIEKVLDMKTTINDLLLYCENFDDKDRFVVKH